MIHVDVPGNVLRQFKIDVDRVQRELLACEDTDHNTQITIEDEGPKSFGLATVSSGGYRRSDIRGTYQLSNLLQELTMAKALKLSTIVLGDARLNENPVDRMARLIKDVFWPNLTRRIDGTNIFKVARDCKDRSNDPHARIYVPKGAPEQYEYYKRIAAEKPKLRLEVIQLPEDPGNEEYVLGLNDAPGLLAIEMEEIEKTSNGKRDFRGLSFVVPGGRFNELYGWDSYMETLGLLVNGQVDLCENMVRHFCFCIQHYGKILNANRTYYLCRSQPPFLTDMALRVYDRIKHKPGSLEFLRKAFLASIKDYYNTWMSEPRYDKVSGLSRYRPGGLGVPPETEPTHFEHILEPYARKHNMSWQDFIVAYNSGRVKEPELDVWLLHDRSVRESGHDTSYRLEEISAYLATVDLNSLLYKYEMDIARTIRAFFGDSLEIPTEWHAKGKAAVEKSSTWDRRAKQRRQIMSELMWDEEKGMFFDYNTVKQEQRPYESATTFWAMWAGVATPYQASIMVNKALERFENYGGLASGTEESRGEISMTRPNRQWDFPFGWAPQQILAWDGLIRYGFEEDAQRLAYKWIHMCTRAFVDYNGVVVEKYDVTRKNAPHKVTAEYGNQGADFKGAPTEGWVSYVVCLSIELSGTDLCDSFGWVNASYVYGLQIVNSHMKAALGVVADWESFEKSKHPKSGKIDKSVLEQHSLKRSGTGVSHITIQAPLAPPHSQQDELAHAAVHETEDRTEHRAPDSMSKARA